MVIWMPRARADLKAIYEYIYEDAPINAKGVVEQILAKTASLKNFPGGYKVVPEAKLKDLHEVSVSAWRIIFHPRNNNIYIITIVHKRQILNDAMMEH